jgi:TRAP-type C4-dicarboxylate transport system permease small subunit
MEVPMIRLHRVILDRIYLLSGYAAAVVIVAMTLSILAQIVSRLPYVNVVFDATEISGFCLAASLFLGLAHTLKAGAHIRVSLVVTRLPKFTQRWAALWCTFLASALSGYTTYHAILMNIESVRFNELSPGLMAIPLWIPQIAMSCGLLILTIAFADEFFLACLGQAGDFRDAEEIDVEEILDSPLHSEVRARS